MSVLSVLVSFIRRLRLPFTIARLRGVVGGSFHCLFKLDARFKDSAESETSRPSRIRLGPLRDESESRVGRLNSEETDLAENQS